MFRKIFLGIVFILCFSLVFAFGTAYAKSDKDGKVTICHYPSGDTEKGQTITVGKGALDAHLEHGDTYGACNGDKKGKGKGTKGRGKTTDEGELEKKIKRWWEFWKENIEE